MKAKLDAEKRRELAEKRRIQLEKERHSEEVRL